MRILFVAMGDSVHTARWISQVSEMGWDIHLFPCVDLGFVHPDLRNIHVHHSFYDSRQDTPEDVKVHGIPLPFRTLVKNGRKLMKRRRGLQLCRLINRIKPDIVHSLEFQHSAYLSMEARKSFAGPFPPWIVSNWGSDIYLFGKLEEHEPKIREILSACDYYFCECRRDVCLAKGYGFNGTVLPVLPNTGGYDLALAESLRSHGPVASRRLIMLKGYQHWAGRALVGLRALERCRDMLDGYEIAVYSATPEMKVPLELFRKRTGIRTFEVPRGTPHDEILSLHGRARTSIGLSISDGISTSFLEALMMGSFPIQSWTACADEWVEDGRTAMLVHPEDADMVETAIRRALSDDAMVNDAAEANAAVARERLEASLVRDQVIAMYQSIRYENRDMSARCT